MLPLLLVVEDYGVPQARWQLELPDANEPSSSPSARGASAAAAAAHPLTVREAKACFTREVFGEEAADAWAFYRLPLGQPLDDDAPLASAAAAAPDSSPGAAASPPQCLRVRAAPRVRGGGGDGGSTGAESRSCFLEMYAEAKPDAVDPREAALARWTRCALTGDPLRAPVVADALGSLMNKDAVVGAMLSGGLPAALRGHVRGLRSLTDVRLATAAAAGAGADAGGGAGAPGAAAAGAGAAGGTTAAAAGSGGVGGGDGGAPSSSHSPSFCCPITGTPMNGRFRFYLHRPSGVVLSERALREAPRAIVAEALFGAEAAAALEDPAGEGGEAAPAAREEGEDDRAAEAGKAARPKPPPPSASLPSFAALHQQAAAGEGDFLPVNPSGPELARLRAAVLARAEAARASKAAAKRKAKSKEEGDRKRPAAAAAAAAAAAGGGSGPSGGGGGGAAEERPAKAPRVPEGATAAVYASIFAKPGEVVKETYCARAASGRY